MKLFSVKRTIFELKNMRDVRVAVDNSLPYPVTNKDLVHLINTWNMMAYHQILEIAKKSNVQSRKVIIETVKEFNETRHSNNYFFSHVGYGGFGMSHLFNECIKNIKEVYNKQLKTFARIGA